MEYRNTIAAAAGLVLALGIAAPAGAEGAITYDFDGSFEDASFALENAIVNRGLVIDFTSHVGEMLNRTGEDVGSAETLFTEADIFLFCSAVVSRAAMEADPMNIVHCPYGITVAEREGKVMFLHRDYPDGPMQDVETLLTEIAKEAAGQ